MQRVSVRHVAITPRGSPQCIRSGRADVARETQGGQVRGGLAGSFEKPATRRRLLGGRR